MTGVRGEIGGVRGKRGVKQIERVKEKIWSK